jgi:hypothetical protein
LLAVRELLEDREHPELTLLLVELDFRALLVAQDFQEQQAVLD